MENADDQQWRNAIDADLPWQQRQEALLAEFAKAAAGWPPEPDFAGAKMPEHPQMSRRPA